MSPERFVDTVIVPGPWVEADLFAQLLQKMVDMGMVLEEVMDIRQLAAKDGVFMALEFTFEDGSTFQAECRLAGPVAMMMH